MAVQNQYDLYNYLIGYNQNRSSDLNSNDT